MTGRRWEVGSRERPLQPYFSLVSDVTAQAVAQNTVYARNHLSLATSADLMNWTICSTLLRDDTGFSLLDSAR
jgi:beta-xylosidase